MNSISYILIACYPDKGMKSYGSKSLIEFNNKKLLQHQIDSIKLYNKAKNYEIIVVSSFETQKIEKAFGSQVKIISLKEYNPIYTGCSLAKYNHVIFIDYGCIFNKNVLYNLNKGSYVSITNHKNIKIDIGCTTEDNRIKHIFFDLPYNKFCNIFSFSELDKNKILQNKNLNYFNLLSFEIINKLIDSGSLFKTNNISNNDFLFFNHMRQKNAVNKFIKKIPN